MSDELPYKYDAIEPLKSLHAHTTVSGRYRMKAGVDGASLRFPSDRAHHTPIRGSGSGSATCPLQPARCFGIHTDLNH